MKLCFCACIGVDLPRKVSAYFCMRFDLIIHSICADFGPQKPLFFRHYTIACANRPKTSRLRVKDLTAICDWKKKKKKDGGILTRAFPLESPSNYL